MSTYKRYDVQLHEQKRETCVGLIQCIKDWTSYVEPETDFNTVGQLSFGKNTSDGVFEYWQPMAMHILSNDIKDIHDGDWVFVDCRNTPTGYDGFGVWKYMKAPCPMPYWGNPNVCKKIVASTDLSLALPQPTKGFIEKYIEEFNKGNEIKTVLVEQTWKAYLNWSGFKPLVSEINDTILIRKIKDDYTERDLKILIGNFVRMKSGLGLNLDEKVLEAWINENLVHPF